METITLDEFLARLKAQDVPREHLAFICPMCETIQSGYDLIMAGAGANFGDIEKYLAFSCVGRWTHQKPPPETKGKQVGCNWTLGGLFSLHKLTVTTPDGETHPRFVTATPEQAQQHMLANLEAMLTERQAQQLALMRKGVMLWRNSTARTGFNPAYPQRVRMDTINALIKVGLIEEDAGASTDSVIVYKLTIPKAKHET